MEGIGLTQVTVQVPLAEILVKYVKCLSLISCQVDLVTYVKLRVILAVHLYITMVAGLRCMESHLGDMVVQMQAFQGCMLMFQVGKVKNMLLFDTSWLSFSGVKSWIVDNTGGEC